MWDFSFVIPSILVLFVLLAFYLLRPRLPIRINRTFITILLLELLVIAFDIVSSYADENYQTVPVPVTVLLNMVYFVLFLARIYWFFLITGDVLHIREKASGASQWLFSLVFIASEAITLSSCFTGAVFRIDEAGYHKGPLYNILYVCFFFYLALSIILLILNRKKLSRPAFFSAVAYNVILIIGNIVRFLFPQYLIMNVFCLLAILIIYLAFENPDFYIAHDQTFNRNALGEVLTEKIGKGCYRILGFGIVNFVDAQSVYGVRQMDYGLRMISAFLQERRPGLMIFYLRMGIFAVVDQGHLDCDVLQKEIAERFLEPWKQDEAELFLRPAFARISSESGIKDSNSVISSLMAALSEYSGVQNSEEYYIDLDHSSESEQRITIKRALLKAVENDSVELFLQPIVKADSGEIVAAEALARIRDDKGGLISPALFIPMAERNGRINRLGEEMLNKSCVFLNKNKNSRTSLKWINVNLSPVQCMNRELSSRFYTILQDNGVEPEMIHLEITEAIMDDFSVLSEQMAAMIDLGFRFSLDDYGSGYSNLGRIKRYPFSNVKLDLELVQKHCEKPDIILPTLIRVFKEQGFSITAEGIETKEMAQMMKEIGCDYLQGFYFSRPVPADEFEKLF